MICYARLNVFLVALGLGLIPVGFSVQAQTSFPLGKPPGFSELSESNAAPPRVDVGGKMRSISEASQSPATGHQEFEIEVLKSGEQAGRLKNADSVPSSINIAEECILQVNEIQQSDGGNMLAPGFSLKLVVPESVKVVELIPHSHSRSEKTIRLSLESNNSDEPIRTAALPRQELPLANTRVISEPTPDPAVGFSGNQLVPGLKETPKKGITGRVGYKKNPFYQAEVVSPPSELPIESGALEIAQTSGEFSGEFSILSSETPAASPALESAEPELIEVEAPVADFEVPIAISGPSELDQGEEGVFAIEVHNKNSEELNNFSVELFVPEGLQLSVLDRPARIDVDRRTVTWDMESLLPSEVQQIQYKVVANLAGTQTQVLTVSKDQSFSAGCELETSVIAEIDLHNEDAPTLSFESDSEGSK